MASSQVEVASSAPFGCVLRNHNHKHSHSHSHSHNNHNRLDGCKTAQDAFRRNLKDLVRGHIHKCISVSSSESGSIEEPSSLNQNPWFADHKRINTTGSLRLKRGEASSPSTSNTSSKEEMLSDISPRKSRVLERWAAQQARAMVSTIEKQSQEAELVASTSSSDDASTDTDISNLGASSLVQVWEARLNHSTSNSCSSKVNSVQPGSPTTRNNAPLVSSSTMEESSMISDAVEPGYDDSLISRESSLGRSESDRTVTDDQSFPSQDQNSEAGNQSQWVRVADIIKRLTSSRRDKDHQQPNANESSPREQERIPFPDPSLHPVTPRLRGRLAFNDLLMQLERGRHRELESLAEVQAVSRFQQRGRIQSLLKIKILQHRNGVQPQWRPNQPNSVPHSSGIMHLRERFNTPTNNASAPAITPRNSHAPQVDQASCSENSITAIMPEENNHTGHVGSLMQQPEENSSPVDEPTSNTHSEEDHHNHTEQGTLPLQLSRIKTIGDVKGSFTPRSDTMSQHTSFEDSTDELQPLDTFSSLNDWFDDAMMEEGEEEEEEEMEDEEEEQQENIAESSHDWISNISRPRSYWEERRREWYEEMLEASSVKEDIRELLQRRTVSSFLCSDFRDRMNHLMMSHVQRQSHLEALEEDDQMETSIEERMEQLMSSYIHQQSNSVGDREETDEDGVEDDEEEGEEGIEREEILEEDNEDGQEDDEDEEGNPLREIINDYDEEEEDGEGTHGEEMIGDYDEEEEDGEGSLRDEIIEDDDGQEEEVQEQEEIPGRHQYDELQTYYYQATPRLQMSPSPPSRLGRYYDHENNSDREQVASTSSQDLPSYHQYYQDSRHHSNHIERLSIEMELINDLRAQMKQLYQEMSELRRSINCCMDMQVKLQGSFMQDSNSAQVKAKRSVDAAPRKGICCICYETQVDSLLYRCGHMCTCLRCAHELQWSSGKCPICRAPIVDVVRAFTDT